MKVIVIGGGAAGMTAAYFAATDGADVLLLEKNEKLGKKMYISGKGRCNLTNNCTPQEFLDNVVSNAKFLRGAIHRFSPQDAMRFFEEHSLSLKTERGNRVFPQSDKSSDVIRTLERAVRGAGAEIRLNCNVTDVTFGGGVFHVETTFGSLSCDRLIVACGGYSYRSTGSDGFGYRVAEKFRHNVVPLAPALCRILCKGTQSLQGLSLKNVTLSAVKGGKAVSEFGEMLFTDDGVSGPAALSLSSRINRTGADFLTVDLKPALSAEVLDARILRDFKQRMNKNLINALDALLPERLIAQVVKQSGIPPYKKVNQITAEERGRLLAALKGLRFDYVGLDDVNCGIVTAGGVDVRQIEPSTMQSKLQKGLYFAGEVLDVDALTGGFNLQTAFSCGYVAGRAAAKESV